MLAPIKHTIPFLFIVVLALSSCGDDKKAGDKGNQSGGEKTLVCRASISQATVSYTVSGGKLNLVNGTETASLNRVSGSGDDVQGKWGPMTTNENGLTMSLYLIVGSNSITNEAQCSGLGQSKSVSVTAQAEITATQIIVKESRSETRDMQ